MLGSNPKYLIHVLTPLIQNRKSKIENLKSFNESSSVSTMAISLKSVFIVATAES